MGKSLRRRFWLIFYYLFAKHLPASYQYQPLGTLAKKMRAAACRRIFRKTGSRINVERGAYFGTGHDIEIGDHSGIGINCHVPNNIKLGKDIMMGQDVLIIAENHKFEGLETPMRLQGFISTDPVVIEDDVWIGARVIILPGLRIGNGAILGAGAVVTKDIPPLAICAGNPARVLRYRNTSADIENKNSS